MGRHEPGRRWGRLAAVVAVVAVIAAAIGFAQWQSGGSPASSDNNVATAPATGATTQPPQIQPIVLAISIDGLNPEAINVLGENRAPNLHRLIAEGSSTLNARSAFELTVTLPNHTGMLTGRGIAGNRGHGLRVNKDPGGTLADVHHGYVPGMFDVAHDNGLTTGIFAQKEKFEFFARSWNGKYGAVDRVGADQGRDKIDTQLIADGADVTGAVTRALTDGQTDLMFMHLQAPDRAGHAFGWMGPQYLAAVESADADLGKVLATIDDSPSLADRVTIIVTADHGGPPGLRKHSQQTLYANFRIPFIAWGRQVAAGQDLYGLNPGRQDPGKSRPGYSGRQPIRNIDVEATALNLLGLQSLSSASSHDWPQLRLN